MKSPLEHLMSLLPKAHIVMGQAHLTARDFAKSVVAHWNRRVVRLDPELSIKFRAIAKLAASDDHTLKFTYVIDHTEIEDLELVLFTTYDADMESWYARRIRVVSKTKEYHYTARDERVLLSFDVGTASEDVAAKLADHQDPLNILARQLYRTGLAHIGERHPELDRTIERPGPFDYAQEMLRYLQSHGDLDIEGVAVLKVKTVAALKDQDDAVLKFDLVSEDLKEGTILSFYLSMDKLFDSIAVRKIRITNKAHKDYSDSDQDHTLTLDQDPTQAARELTEQLKHDMFGDVVREMVMRAAHHMSGEEF